MGARGYTVTDARDEGSRGRRDATLGPHANIRLEVLCSTQTASAVCEALRGNCYANYSMVLFVTAVEVLRTEKF